MKVEQSWVIWGAKARLAPRPESGRSAGPFRVGDKHRGIVCPFLTIPFGSPSSSDLRHMQRTRSVDSIQFLPFLTTDVK